MDPLFGAAVAGKIGYDQIQGHIDEERQKRLMKKQQEYTEKNMALAQQMQQADRQIAPLQSAEAMERAGLSSTLLTDGKFQLAGVTNTPGPSSPGPAYHASPLELTQMENSAAQSDLLRAQAEKTKVETKEISEEQTAVDRALRGWLQSISDDDKVDPNVRGYADQLLATGDKLGRATMKAMQDFISFQKSDRDSILDQLDYVYQKKLKELAMVDDLPSMEHDGRKIDFEKKIPELAKLYAEESYILGQTENLPSEKALNQAKAQEALTNAQKLHDTDLIALMKNPDDAQVLKDLGAKVIEGGITMLPWFAGAKVVKGLGKGGKKVVDKGKELFKKFTGRSGSKSVPVSKTNSPRIPGPLQKKLDDEKFVTETLSRLPEKVRERAHKEWRDRSRYMNDKRSFADFLRDKSKEETLKHKRHR